MITYLEGDATYPIKHTPNRIIAHVCNDAGFWGKGFVKAISKRWSKPEISYRLNIGYYELGDVEFVLVQPGLWVANMIAQHGIHWVDGEPPIRYAAIRNCLKTITNFALDHDASVHMPRIGAGLAGGDWSRISHMIDHILDDIDTTVYTLPKRRR